MSVDFLLFLYDRCSWRAPLLIGGAVRAWMIAVVRPCGPRLSGAEEDVTRFYPK